MLLGEAAFKARLKDIEAAIGAKKIIIDQLKSRLALADKMEDDDDAAAERKAVKHKMDEAIEAIKAFEKVLTDVIRDWTEEENRVIGHVVLSPAIDLDDSDDGFTEDWVVVEIHPTKIARLNFIGNAIDLGSIEVDKLTTWMYPTQVRLSTLVTVFLGASGPSLTRRCSGLIQRT